MSQATTAPTCSKCHEPLPDPLVPAVVKCPKCGEPHDSTDFPSAKARAAEPVFGTVRARVDPRSRAEYEERLAAGTWPAGDDPPLDDVRAAAAAQLEKDGGICLCEACIGARHIIRGYDAGRAAERAEGGKIDRSLVLQLIREERMKWGDKEHLRVREALDNLSAEIDENG